MDDKAVVSKKAADLLARRPHFRKELEVKLLRRGYSEEVVKEVLDDFKGRGYLNDGGSALLYMEELKRKKYGKYEAERKLVSKGLDKATASRAASTFFLENDEIANIKYLLDKKKFNLKDLGQQKKAFDFLLRRGFNSDLVRRVIKLED